jgi:hypothetical protein
LQIVAFPCDPGRGSALPGMRRRRWPGACRCPGAGGSDRRAHRYKKRDLPRSDLNRQPAVPDCRVRRRGADYRAGGLAPRAFTCSRQRTARDRPGNRPAAAGQERYCRRRLKARGSFRQGKTRRDRWRDTGRHTASLVDGDISSFSLAFGGFKSHVQIGLQALPESGPPVPACSLGPLKARFRACLW